MTLAHILAFEPVAEISPSLAVDAVQQTIALESSVDFSTSGRNINFQLPVSEVVVLMRVTGVITVPPRSNSLPAMTDPPV